MKPLCLTNEKPCIKTTSVGFCCSGRCAIPEDGDTPRLCACYGIKCCGTQPFKCNPACCEPIAPLPPTSMPDAVEVEEAQMNAEYILCAFGFGMCTMYVPDTRTDAFGMQNESLCLCCNLEGRYCMLPKDAAGYELMLVQAGQCNLVKPPCLRGGPLYKGVARVFCSTVKFAVPCDYDVPFAVSLCSYKFCEKSPGSKCIWCQSPKLDPKVSQRPRIIRR